MSNTNEATADILAEMREQAFDAGFHNMMASAMHADWYEKHGKPVPQELKKRLAAAVDWINGLSNEEYSRLIH